jgi:hypothetical protein
MHTGHGIQQDSATAGLGIQPWQCCPHPRRIGCLPKPVQLEHCDPSFSTDHLPQAACHCCPPPLRTLTPHLNLCILGNCHHPLCEVLDGWQHHLLAQLVCSLRCSPHSASSSRQRARLVGGACAQESGSGGHTLGQSVSCMWQSAAAATVSTAGRQISD